jgi:hypothetical protein
MNEYRLSITQTINHVVYAYGVDLAAAEGSAVDAMNEHGRLLEGCEVDIVCERVAPMSLIDGYRVVDGRIVGMEPFMYQVVPDEDYQEEGNG